MKIKQDSWQRTSDILSFLIIFLSYNTEQVDIIVELDHFHSKRKHLKFQPQFYLSRFFSVCQNKTRDSNFEQNRTTPYQISSFCSNSLSIYHCLIIWYSYSLYRSRCTLNGVRVYMNSCFKVQRYCENRKSQNFPNFYIFIFLQYFSFQLWCVLPNIDQ